jgi:hypothetical protein
MSRHKRNTAPKGGENNVGKFDGMWRDSAQDLCAYIERRGEGRGKGRRRRRRRRRRKFESLSNLCLLLGQ